MIEETDRSRPASGRRWGHVGGRADGTHAAERVKVVEGLLAGPSNVYTGFTEPG